jgi:hypothetical protein
MHGINCKKSFLINLNCNYKTALTASANNEVTVITDKDAEDVTILVVVGTELGTIVGDATVGDVEVTGDEVGFETAIGALLTGVGRVGVLVAVGAVVGIVQGLHGTVVGEVVGAVVGVGLIGTGLA